MNVNKSTIQHIELTIPPFPPSINMNNSTIQHIKLTIPPFPTTHKHEEVNYTTCRVNYSHPQTWTSWLYKARYYFNDTTQNCWPIKKNYFLLLTTWKHYILGLFYRTQSEFHTLGLMYFIQNIIIYRPFDWCGWRFSTLPWNQWPAQKKIWLFVSLCMYVCMYVLKIQTKI
jgi:hypothetical protein